MSTSIFHSLINVKVSPGASRERVGPWMADGALKVAVSAPPEGGKANAAVCRLLADRLGLPVSAVCVLRGVSSSRKTIRITGLDEAAIKQRISSGV